MTPLFGEPSIEKLAAKGKVKDLVKQLWHKNSTRREVAMKALSEFNDPSIVEALLLKIKEAWETYGQDEWKYRQIAAYIGGLDKYFSDKILSELVEIYYSTSTLFNDEGKNLRWRIENYVRTNGRPAFDSLTQMLQRAREGGYEEAYDCKHYFDTLDLLVETADERVPAVLIEHLEVKISGRIRSHAIALLGQIEATEALPHLVRRLEDEEVIESALRSLRKIGDASAIPKLTSLLHDHPNADVRSGAAYTLGHLDESSVVPHLITALQDTNEDVVLAAASALGKLRDKRSLQPLCEALISQRLPHSAAVEMIQAIGEMMDATIVPALMTIATTHPQPYVRSQSMTILENILMLTLSMRSRPGTRTARKGSEWHLSRKTWTHMLKGCATFTMLTRKDLPGMGKGGLRENSRDRGEHRCIWRFQTHGGGSWSIQ